MSLNKIALGTAQLGLNYGINNLSGKPNHCEIESILNFALSQGINTLDTAIAYGDSETVLGNIGIDKFDVYTKLSSTEGINENKIESWVLKSFENSLSRLKKDCISGLLLHRPMELLDKKGYFIFKALEKIKEQKLVKNIGVSVYSPEELSKIVDTFDVDVVQIPFNIIDSRWDDLLVKMNSNIEIHVRSVFLQGLLLMEPSKRKKMFSNWSFLWGNLENWLTENEITAIQACIGGLLYNKKISKLVLGTETVTQLKEIVNVAKDVGKIEIPSTIRSNDFILLNPSNWN